MKTRQLLLTLLCALCSFCSLAHGYWLELEGTNKPGKAVSVKMFYGDYPVGERLSGKTLDKMKDIRVYVVTPDGEKQTIPMTQFNDFWQGSFTPQTKGVYEVIGINDEREVQDWTKHQLGITRPVQYLKMSYDIGKSGKNPSPLFLDAQISKASKDSYEVTLLKEGKPLPAQKFVVAEFDKGETEFTTDAQGKATIKTPDRGLYILSVDWIDTVPGEFKGKQYETVRHRLDISLTN